MENQSSKIHEQPVLLSLQSLVEQEDTYGPGQYPV